MHSHRASLYPRHQQVALDLLGEEEQSGDEQGLHETSPGDEERDSDRRYRPEEGPQYGNDLRGRHPGPYGEGVLPDGEEHNRPPEHAHDRAQQQLPPQVPDQRTLDCVEKLEALLTHRLGNGIEQSVGDLLPLKQQVDGDEHHQEQVEDSPEDPENPTDDARRNVRDLFRGRRVLPQELQDSVLVELGHVPADVGHVLEPIGQGDDLVDEILRVADHDLYLSDRGDDNEEQRDDDDEAQDQEHPDNGYGPRYPQPFEATHEGVEGVGQDAGGQEGEQHAADLAHKRNQQHHPRGQQDVLEVCRDDQFSGWHPVSDPISAKRNIPAPDKAARGCH